MIMQVQKLTPADFSAGVNCSNLEVTDSRNMRFKDWLSRSERVVLEVIKPIFNPIRWPDATKISFDDEQTWFYFQATYSAGGREFVFRISKHRDDPATAHIDGLNSSGDVSQGGTLEEILPQLMAELKKIGISKVKWSPAISNFGRQSALTQRERSPEQEARIRDRLFNRLTRQAGVERVA